MELLYFIGFWIGLYAVLSVIRLVFRLLCEFIETRRYMRRLEDLRPQIDAIDYEGMAKAVSEFKENHVSLREILDDKYCIRSGEHVKGIGQYVQEEAAYRRSVRKPARRSTRSRHRRYRRYY